MKTSNWVRVKELVDKGKEEKRPARQKVRERERERDEKQTKPNLGFIACSLCPGILNEMDNCPFIPNAHQNDTDGDGVGDVCDNCLEDANPWQENKDGDAAGDACDYDNDSDR